MVVTKDLSRLARNTMTSYYLDEYFPSYGIRYIAVLDGYDSLIEDSNKELAWVKNGMNENYCRETSKKVRNGLMQAKKNGLFTGWKAPYGYKKSKKDYHKLIIDEEASLIVRKIFDLAYKEKSPGQIAQILSSEKIPTPSSYANLNRNTISKNRWCSRTVKDILSNETYIGNLTQGKRKKVSYKIKKEIRTPKSDWIIVKGTHEPIIEKEKFYTVQNLLDKSKKSKNNNQSPSLLRGFIFCKECNHAITITKSNDKKRKYCACSYYRKYSKEHLCTPHTMNYEKLEQKIFEELKYQFQNQINKNQLIESIEKKGKVTKRIDSINNEISKINENQINLTTALDNVYFDYVTKKIDQKIYEKTTLRLNIKINQNKSKMKDLQKKVFQLDKKGGIIDYKELIYSFFKTTKFNKILLVNIIDKIYISEDKKIEIKYKFKKI